MDTLGLAASVLALMVHIATSARTLHFLGASSEMRPPVFSIIILLIASLGVFLGYRGYHRDWPRWANGRAMGAVFIGALLAAITLINIFIVNFGASTRLGS